MKLKMNIWLLELQKQNQIKQYLILGNIEQKTNTFLKNSFCFHMIK